MAREAEMPRRRLLPGQRAALTLKVTGTVALVPGYAFVAPPSRWDDPVLLAVLGALSVVAFRSVVRLPSGVGFDSMVALMLLAVALVGPLPALGVIVLPWLDLMLVRRGKTPPAPWYLTLPGYLGAYGWQAIAAGVLLETAGTTDPAALANMGWLLAAGGVLYTVGWALGPAIYVPLWLGQPFRSVARSYLDMLPVAALMVTLAAATVMLTASMGVVALGVFAVIAILPQSFLTYAARTRPIARLDRATATFRYTRAIALHLGLSRKERQHLARVLEAAARHPPTGDALDYACAMLDEPSHATYDAQLAAEWWNGSGTPFGLREYAIPQAARVLAVADTWAALTAKDTPQLGHRDALEHMQTVAGVRLDPAVVHAARAVISQEPITAEHPAPEPRLHHLRVPAPLRRTLVGSATPDALPGA